MTIGKRKFPFWVMMVFDGVAGVKAEGPHGGDVVVGVEGPDGRDGGGRRGDSRVPDGEEQ